MSSEPWRKATAYPASPGNSPNRAGRHSTNIDVSLPGGGYATGGGADQSAALRGEITRLQTSLTAVLSDRDKMVREMEHTRADSSAVSELARRDLMESSTRERRRADNAESALISAQHDIDTLKRKLQDSDYSTRETNDSLAYTKQLYDREILDLKVVHQDGMQAIRNENLVLVDQNRKLDRERMALERIVDSNKDELRAAERMIQEQSHTIRTMSQDMARRDPINQVKHHREVVAEESRSSVAELKLKTQLEETLIEVDTLKKQVAILEKERDAAHTEIDELEAEVKQLAGAAKKAKSTSQAAVQADLAKRDLELNNLKAANSSLRKQFDTLTEDYNDLVEVNEEEKRKAAIMDGQVTKEELEKQIKDVKAKNKSNLAKERETYEKKIMSLTSELKATKAELNEQEDAFEAQREEMKKKAAKQRQLNEAKLADQDQKLRDAQALLVTKEKLVVQTEQKMKENATAKEVLGTQETKSSTNAGPKGNDVVVTFTVESCAGLLQRDGFMTGSSDPFVVVRKGTDPKVDPLLRTPTVEDNLNPTWRKDEATVKIPINTADADFLSFQVWDLDSVGNDNFLGEFLLAIGDVFATGSGRRTFALAPRLEEEDDDIITNSKNLGTITLNLVIPGVAPTKQVGGAKPAPTHTLTEEVTFYVSACEGLMDRDGGLNGDSDPFIVIKDPKGKTVLTSGPIDNTLAPEYAVDETSVKLNLVKSSRGFVTFEVWNHNTISHDFLGLCRLSVADVFTGGNRQRKMQLEPHPKETDEKVVKMAGKLGTLTLNTTIMADQAAIAKSRGLDSPKPIKTKNVPYDVTFYVSRCDNLWERDGGGMLSGISDPFVKILGPKGGKPIKTTEVVDDCLNPTWPVDKGSAKLTLMPNQDGFVSFEVWNYNKFKNDFLGVHRFAVGDVFSMGNGEHVFPLQARLKENDPEVKAQALKGLGTITITTTVIVAPPVAAGTKDGKITEAAAAQQYDVSFYIAACMNLLDRDGGGFLSGVSDPIIKVLDTKKEIVFTSEEVSNTLDPRWEPADATVKMKLSPSGTGTVEFQAWNKNPIKNDFLGSVRLTEAEVFAQESGPRILPFGPRAKETEQVIKDAKTLGKLKLVVTVPDGLVPKKQIAAATATAAVGGAVPPTGPVSATVTISSCANLLQRDGFGTGEDDAFVRLYNEEGKEVLITEVVEDSLNPTWPASKATTKLQLSPKAEQEGKKKIRIEVWNKNNMSDDFLGCVIIAGDDLLALGNGTHSLELTPRGKEADSTITENAGKLGTITFVLKIAAAEPLTAAMTPSKPAQPAGTATSRAASTTPTSTPSKPQASAAVADEPVDVIVQIVKATNLLDRDGFGSGESDPFVRITGEDGGDPAKTTETVDNNLNPEWKPSKESVTLHVTPGGAAKGKKKIRLEVFNYNKLMSHDILGCIVLDGDELIALGSGTHTLPLTARPKETDDKIADKAPGELGELTFVVKLPAATTPAVTPGTTPSKPPPPSTRPAAATTPAASAAPVSPPPAASRAAPVPTPPTATAAAPQPAPAPPAPMPPKSVKIHVKGCTALNDRDGGGFVSGVSDPIVKVIDNTGKQIFQTPEVKNKLDPTWDSKIGSVRTKVDPSAAGSFQFVVEDVNLGSNAFMGLATLAISEMMAEGVGIHDFDLPLGPRAGEKEKEILNNVGNLGTLHLIIAII